MSDCDIRQSFCGPQPYAAPGDQYQYDIYFIVDQLQRLARQSEALRKKLCEVDDVTRAQGKDIKAAECDIRKTNERLDDGDFNTGDYHEWAAEHMPEIVADMVRFVSFGLAEDGRFVAYVPESWSFLRFDTVLDPTSPCFGRLIINY